ncbi:unnamed protein product [Closterium sp. NIES-54]
MAYNYRTYRVPLVSASLKAIVLSNNFFAGTFPANSANSYVSAANCFTGTTSCNTASEQGDTTQQATGCDICCSASGQGVSRVCMPNASALFTARMAKNAAVAVLPVACVGDWIFSLLLAQERTITRAAQPSRAAQLSRAALPGAEPRRPAEPHCPTEPRHPAEPRRPTEPHCPARAAPTATAVSTATAATAATAAMASPTVLTFDAEGRAVDIDTLLWHHRLGHPSLPRLRGMASRTLVSGLPRSLPPLPPGPAPTCVPCVEGRQRAAPHSSTFPPTEASLQTLHMDVWGPAHVRGQGQERYFLLIRGARFGSDLPVPRLHSDRGGEFSSDFLRAFCRLEGIRQTFTLPASPQQNGIPERRIGMVMDVACTSMIHAAAPHFLWPFAVQYVAHQINLQPRGPAPSGVSQVDPAKPVEVAVDSCAARYAEPVGAGIGGAEPGGAEPERVESWGAEPERVESGGAEPELVEPGGAVSEGADSGGSLGVPLRREPLSPQWLREWYARSCRRATGAAGAGAAGGAAGAGAAGGAAGAGVAGGAAGAGATGGAAGAGAAGGATGAGATGGAAGAGAPGGAAGAGAAGAAGPGNARTRGTGAAGAGGAAGVGAAGTGAGGAAGVVTGDHGAEGTGAVSAISGGAARPRPYYVPLLQQVLAVHPLPGPSPYSRLTRGLTERREPESRPVSRVVSPVRTAHVGRRVPHPPPVPSTHSMTLRPSTAPQHVPLPSPLASSLPDGPDPESDSLRAASPTVTRSLATTVADPLFESSAASSLVAELVDFAAACRLDFSASLFARSASACVYPPSVGEGPYSSQWQAAKDAKMASWKSTGTYVDGVPLPGANIVSGMWIFRVKRPPGSPPVFKAHYVPRGFSRRQGVEFFQTFSPTLKMTTFRVLLHVAAQRDDELDSLDFSTAFLQGSLHEEIWLRRPPGFTRMTLAALGFAPSTSDPSLFLRTATTLPPFYVLVFATADTEALAHVKSELQKRHTCTDLGEPTSYLGLRITRERAQRTITLTQSHMVHQVLQRFDFTYSSPQSTPLPTGHSLSAPPSNESVEPSGPYPELVGCLMHRKVQWDAAKRVLRYLYSTSGMGLVLGGRAQVVLIGHADASWLRWLTYLVTDLGEAPRSPLVMYVDNKAMIALCREHRLEHRTKHIALRYFLARELQQRGQLRLAYVASQANTADVFTKALQPCDHQRFCTVLGLVHTAPHLLTS